jgi:hypothetical protein
MRTLLLALLAFVACVAAPLAQAGKPSKTPASSSDFVDTTCGFAVDVHIIVDGQSAIAFDNGRVIFAGPFAAQFSANGNSVTLNISGPAILTQTDDSVTITAHGVGVGATRLSDGTLTLAYNSGVISIDPDTGVGTVVHGTTHLDLCGALAP